MAVTVLCVPNLLDMHGLSKILSLPKGKVLTSDKVSIQSFCQSQLPFKSVNSCVISAMIKNELTNLCGNRLLPNDLIKFSVK